MLAPSFRNIKTQHDALTLLVECGSHAAFNKEEAEAICGPFGFAPRLHYEKANTDPKGYIDPEKKKGERVYITGGWLLAEQIANNLNLSYRTDYFGRGRIFAAACGAIREYIDKLEAMKSVSAKRTKKGGAK